VRNLRRNNTEYKVQAFNALGSATSSKTVVLRSEFLITLHMIYLILEMNANPKIQVLGVWITFT